MIPISLGARELWPSSSGAADRPSAPSCLNYRFIQKYFKTKLNNLQASFSGVEGVIVFPNRENANNQDNPGMIYSLRSAYMTHDTMSECLVLRVLKGSVLQ